MKYLYLIRHAKSSWKFPDLSDIDRPLNKRGNRDAPFMGNLLKGLGVQPDLIISSPAKRALTTAQVIAEKVEFDQDKIIVENSVYEASVIDLMRIIKGFDDQYDRVFLFGHNPGLTEFSNFISDMNITNIPTCGIVKIEFKVNSWLELEEGSGAVKSFDYPKKYK